MAQQQVYIERGTPRLEEYRNALATPTRIKSPPNGSISGCLYDEQGSLIRLSRRFGGFRGDFYPSLDPCTLPADVGEAVETLAGRTLYLGHYMPHFGHFLLETLSTFWVRRLFEEFDTYLFHPFVFGISRPRFVEEAFTLLGLDSSRVKLVERTTRVENVTVPERLTKLNQSVHEMMSDVYGALRDASVQLTVDPDDSPLRIYVSRARMSRSKVERAVVNEPLLERVSERCGFTVVYPETRTLTQQIRMFASADVVCGLSGSALHQCVFMRPGARLMEIGDARSRSHTHPMQELCNLLSECTAEFLPFRGLILNRETRAVWANLSAIRRDLHARYNEEEDLDGSFGSRQSSSLLSAWNTGYLLLLSVLRLVLRRVRRRFR